MNLLFWTEMVTKKVEHKWHRKEKQEVGKGWRIKPKPTEEGEGHLNFMENKVVNKRSRMQIMEGG